MRKLDKFLSAFFVGTAVVVLGVTVFVLAAAGFAAALMGSLAPARAADLPITLVEPPVVIIEPSNICTIHAPGGAVEVFQEPLGESSGFLPSGMIVEVIDTPYSDRIDLWVRIKPPRLNQYYGWVETSRFVCT